MAVLEGGYRGWEGQRLPAGSLSLGCRAAAGNVCTWHVASRPATKLESFSFFSLSDLVTLFRMMGRVFAGRLQVVREQPMDAHVQAGCAKRQHAD